VRRPRLLIATTLLLTLVLALTGCGGSGDSADSGGPTGPTGPTDASATVKVVAVQSQTEVVTALADAFEEENPDIGLDVTFTERANVAPVAEDEQAVVVINESDLIGDVRDTEGAPVDFGSDPMQIIVPTGNPGDVEDVSAFGDDGVDTAVCDEAVPCGVGAKEVFEEADIDATAEVLATGGKVLTGVRKGDLDAGLLNRSQGARRSDRDWEIIPLPEDIDAAVDFQVVLVSASDEGQAFIDWLGDSAAANEILVSHGLRAGTSSNGSGSPSSSADDTSDTTETTETTETTDTTDTPDTT
jgi:molybdate transport system substrate-binding protein